MVLGIILLSLMMLAVFVFSYQSMVRQQNLRAHREQIGAVAETLAVSGLNLIADHLNADPEPILMAGAPTLLTPGTPSTVALAPAQCEALRAELDDYFQKLTFFAVKPQCTEVSVVFTDILPLTPDTTAAQFQGGRDPAEKSGEAVLTCTVSYQSLKRRAEVRRQFRVVSMVPGPFARFTLFVPTTPNYFSYNALGVNFDGTVDSTYIPPGTTVGPFAPLTLFHGSETAPLDPGFTARPPTTDLLRGWVFLGPSRDPVATGPVLLRIPSGYNSAAGGHFLFSKPVVVPPSPMAVVAPENITDPTHFQLPPAAPPGVQAMLGGVYQGFFTKDPGLANPAAGAAGWNLWPDLLTGAAWTPADRFLCASSWLFPFGDKNNVSRTLMVGPVLAGFLKFYYLKEHPPSATPWKGIIKGVPLATYNPTDTIAMLAAGSPPAIRYQDLFRQAFGGKPGYGSLLTVMPTNFVVNPAASPLTTGVPFNIFFDFMAYDGPPAAYPKPLSYQPSPTGLGQPTDPYFVPYHDLIKDQAAVGVRGLHPYGPPEGAAYANKWFEIRFKEGGTTPDDIYFRGNLANFDVRASNLMQRVTHVIDLASCTSAAEERELLERSLFYRETALPPLPADPPGLTAVSPPLTTPVYRLQKRGILMILRRKDGGVNNGPSWGPLDLPGPLLLDKSAILIVGNGDVRIAKPIRSPELHGCPYWLCSVVCLQGNIILGTTEQVDAYLTALAPGTPGGRLLSAGPGINRMNIVGGLAIREMGLANPPTGQSTMEHFPQGGTIRYNPRFNPSLPAQYAMSRVFVLEEKARSVVVGGGD
ncbi:MAG: hypothetical protein OZSIB_0359 [Candidatus Ozemobacter sibiricus]|uniref:Uncharacterized protein n=1 Tax=Candidatus Ozemobacter sibiricus TaxID=2268124 RepID=A0A367ZME3_9BACT|nr:MAG: hypothetical protein OZSIB_0359 [Candidatus Ozemobacter sibiricus]